MGKTDEVTTQEAARQLGVTQGWVQELCNAGTIAARRFGTQWAIPPAEIERYRRAFLGKIGRPRTGRGRAR